MSTTQDPDLLRSAAHRHMIGHLSGPFRAGAVDTLIPVSEEGEVQVAWESREPLLMAGPLSPLNAERLQLQAALPNGQSTSLEFKPYTEAGAFLPLYRPAVSGETKTASPFSLTLTLQRVTADGIPHPVAPQEIGRLIEVRLLEGLLGRMAYVMGAEKMRLRRHARELTAMRMLPFARDDALDRIGAGLGVPRLTGTIRFVSPTALDWPATFGDFRFGERRFGPGSWGAIVTENRRERDDEYRRRLAIYRPFARANRRQAVESLNGPGAQTDPNRGLLSELGFQHRFRVIEADNEFAFSIHLMSTGESAYRENFLSYVRSVHLIWPGETAAAAEAHNNRYLPPRERNRIDRLRSSLRRSFTFREDEPVLAPMLALAMDRVALCRRALGSAGRWDVLRTQDSDGGSRYELGLGAELRMPSAAELDRMAERLRDPNRPPVHDDSDIEGVLRSMVPRSAAEDPEGKWLLDACGLSTVHRLASGRLYISHLPILGMQITGPSTVEPGDQASLELHYRAPGDQPGSVVLVTGLTAATAKWELSGGHPWTHLGSSEAQALWERAVLPSSEAKKAFDASGLPSVATSRRLIDGLTRLSSATDEPTIATLQLNESHAGQLLSGHPQGLMRLRKLVSLLRESGISSALPLVTDTGEVALVVGTIGLPLAGTNLSQKRATSFRWYALPIGPSGTGDGQIRVTRNSATYSPWVEGLTAVVAVGYARRGLTDPFEFRVELPEEATLNLLQYEFLMNLLQHIHPLSIGVNSFSIRQLHVDLDEDGQPEPLQPNVSRTYRQFRLDNQRGRSISEAKPD